MTIRYNRRTVHVKAIPKEGGWSYSIHVEQETAVKETQIVAEDRIFNTPEAAVAAGSERALVWIDRAELVESDSVFT